MGESVLLSFLGVVFAWISGMIFGFMIKEWVALQVNNKIERMALKKIREDLKKEKE